MQTRPAAAKRVYALETELAKNQWTRVQNRDADKTYNKVATADLAKTLGEFKLERLMPQVPS